MSGAALAILQVNGHFTDWKHEATLECDILAVSDIFLVDLLEDPAPWLLSSLSAQSRRDPRGALAAKEPFGLLAWQKKRNDNQDPPARAVA